jgi:hypothetical protein
MGNPYTATYEKFRDELQTFLRDSCGVDPRILGKNEYPSGSPLEHIQTTMRTCAGVIIVAYERKYLERGMEKREAELPQKPQKLENCTYTTTWNHIESAMAFTLGLPLYIICQEGLSEDGLIESKLDWYVNYVVIEPGALSKPALSDSIRNWIETRVIPRSRRSNILESLGGKLKFSEMTPSDLWHFFGMYAGMFLLGAICGALFKPTLLAWIQSMHDLHFI